jgi:hypothetical protein
VFAQHLMPWMEYANNDPELIEYIDRLWNGRGFAGFNGGWWAQPDPCAPPDSRESSSCQPHTANDDGCIYYKKTWGPDPAKPGDCIRHNGDPLTDGRWSSLHGTYAPPTGWGRSSYITLGLWMKYRDCADPGSGNYPCTGMGPEVNGSAIREVTGLEQKPIHSFQVFPNPSAGAVHIIGIANGYLVYDHTGSLVREVIDHTVLKEGIYFITTPGHEHTQKVMVIK